MATAHGFLIQDGPSLGALSRAMRPGHKGTKLIFWFSQPNDLFCERKCIPLEFEVCGTSHPEDSEYTGLMLSVKYEGELAQLRYNPQTRIGKFLTEEDLAEH